ncbi:olfactory receptor 7C1-like [Sus scrofa]|uniref:Olfactory receptor n=1 Tax=Sus scrofa TaxID=9823 RepID=A0A8W4FFS4_PIG|nr:olfactory receptor 7C1-like [Sus scrofa]XP_020937980.1 olfactory receptor 7C1-like [Sus scrofa]
MDTENQTGVSEFLLSGFSEDPELQPLLFVLFLSMYLVSVLGNLLIILTVTSDSRLHTPMYYFLSHLSFSDICVNSSVVPKVLVNIQTASRAITYAGCITQMFFSSAFVCLDNLLLSVMAYDRFVAICHPLHYTIMMNKHLCGLLVLVSWIASVLVCLLHSLMVLRLSFCTHTEIAHFFCELTEVLKSACSDALSNYVTLYSAVGLLAVVPLFGIIFSYSKIISSTLKMSSVEGRYKAFSTCGSHLTVISLFYGTGLGVYLSSAFSSSSSMETVASVIYSMVIPMLNPFIYSLRNRDMKRALRKLFSRFFFSL